MNPRLYPALFVLCASAVFAAEKNAVPFRSISFDAACEAAAAEHKIVFIDFFTTWCGPCKELDRTTWNDPAVAKLLGEKAVPLKIDAEKEVALAKRYAIDAYPTLLLVKPDGSELDRIVGYRDPKEFTEEFTFGLSGKGAVARAKEKVAVAKVDEESVDARYRLGETLARSGRLEEALKEYLWCYDEGMAQVASFAGVRNSFLISSIAELGRKYPPALAALRERRDKAEEQMNADPRDRTAAVSFASLNDVLKENERTLAAYDRLADNDPRRKGMLVRVYRLLIKSKRYDDAAKAMPFDRMKKDFERNLGEMKQMAEMSKGGGRPDPFPGYVVHTTTDNIEVLVGSNQLPAAQSLADKLLAMDNSDETRKGLHEAAVRAGHPELWAKSP